MKNVEILERKDVLVVLSFLASDFEGNLLNDWLALDALLVLLVLKALDLLKFLLLTFLLGFLFERAALVVMLDLLVEVTVECVSRPVALIFLLDLLSKIHINFDANCRDHLNLKFLF